MPDFSPPGALGVALGELELAHGGFSLDQQGGAGFGEADFTLLTDKQARAQRGFHVLNLAAQGRRRDAQLFSRAGEIALPGDGEEVAEMADFHSGISSKVMKCRVPANKTEHSRR